MESFHLVRLLLLAHLQSLALPFTPLWAPIWMSYLRSEGKWKIRWGESLFKSRAEQVPVPLFFFVKLTVSLPRTFFTGWVAEGEV